MDFLTLLNTEYFVVGVALFTLLGLTAYYLFKNVVNGITEAREVRR